MLQTPTHVQQMVAKGKHMILSIFTTSTLSKIIAFAPCAISHYVQYIYSYLSCLIIQTTDMRTFSEQAGNNAHAAVISKYL